MPEDGTPEVVMTVNNMAANKGLGQVKYSAKVQRSDEGSAGELAGVYQ